MCENEEERFTVGFFRKGNERLSKILEKDEDGVKVTNGRLTDPHLLLQRTPEASYGPMASHRTTKGRAPGGALC